jgi:PAS domain S-box-containing protein
MVPAMSLFDLTFGLLKNLVAGTLSIVFIGLVRAWFWKRNRTIPSGFLGLLFAGAAFVGMLFPVIYSPGVFRDFRNSIVALASLYGGIQAGIVAAGLAGAFRWYLGGGGTFGGIMGLVCSAVLGALFHDASLFRKPKISPWRLPLLGASVFAITFLWSWTLPREQVWAAVQLFVLPEMIAYPLVTTLFGSLYRLETDRQSSMDHFRAVFNESPFGILILDPVELRILDVNPAFCEMVGYRNVELLGLTLASIVHRDHAGELGPSAAQGSGRLSGNFRAERKFRKKDGETVWMNLAMTEIREHAGQAASIAVLEDITQRKTADEALRRYLQRLEILHKTDQAILRAQSTDKTIQESLRYVRQMIPCRWASVMLLNPEAKQSGEVADSQEAGTGESVSTVSLDRLPQVEKLENGEAVLFADLSAREHEKELLQRLSGEGIRSYAMIPLNIQGKLIGTLNLGTTEPSAFDKGKIEIAYEVANSLAVAIQNTRLLEEVMRHQKELQRMSARIIDAQEAERKRISVELHDEMGQALTGISINLGVIEKAVVEKTDPAIVDRLREAKGLADQASDQIKDLAFRLRPSILDDLGLEPTLRWYVGRYTTRTAIPVDLEVSLCEGDIEPDIRTLLYRVVQEALNNIAKHAGASHVRVRLSCDQGWAVLVVEDDGRGFAVDGKDPGGNAGRGLGLLGMRERVAFINGIFTIQSIPGEGTRITAKVPTVKRGPI